MADLYRPDGVEDDSNAANAPAGALKDWQTPELLVESIKAVTRGGTLFTLNTPDDAYYS